jgi:hypothetical protein
MITIEKLKTILNHLKKDETIKIYKYKSLKRISADIYHRISAEETKSIEIVPCMLEFENDSDLEDYVSRFNKGEKDLFDEIRRIAYIEGANLVMTIVENSIFYSTNPPAWRQILDTIDLKTDSIIDIGIKEGNVFLITEETIIKYKNNFNSP